MSAKMADKGWLGIEGDKDDAGYLTVTKVVAGSPAEAAGFRPGDVLVAVDGVKYTKDNAEALHAVKVKLGPGSRATYTVKRGGAKVELEATLTNVPREVMAQWIGEHMLEHHAKVRMASK
jgi:S1-C subfamily serine protease